MSVMLTTIDLLVASIRQSFVAANELILRSSQSRADTVRTSAELDTAAMFIINNTLGNPSAAIPLALFHSSVSYYLSTLRFDLPCYTMSGARFLLGRHHAGTKVLHSFSPTPWQRLMYICHLYHMTVEIDVDQTRVSLRPASAEEAGRLAEAKRPAAGTAWAFRLAPEQERQLLSLSRTVAKPIYWRSAFMRLWRQISGKSN